MNFLLTPLLYLTTLHVSFGGPLRLQKRAAFYIANETACVVDNTVYSNGDPIPTDDPCESCKCRPPGFACSLKECEVKPGCRAVRRTGHCCPDYVCGCEHDGRMYRDGDEIRDSQNPCYTCHCLGSSIACAFMDCLFRVDCTPVHIPGECCPQYTNCTTSPKNPFEGIHRNAETNPVTASSSAIVPGVSYVDDTTVPSNIDTTIPEKIEIATNPPELLNADLAVVITETKESAESTESEELNETSNEDIIKENIQSSTPTVGTSTEAIPEASTGVELKVDESVIGSQINTKQTETDTVKTSTVTVDLAGTAATTETEFEHSTVFDSQPESTTTSESVEPDKIGNTLEPKNEAYGKSIKFDEKNTTELKEHQNKTETTLKPDEVSSEAIPSSATEIVNETTSHSSSEKKVSLYNDNGDLRTESVETVTAVIHVNEGTTNETVPNLFKSLSEKAEEPISTTSPNGEVTGDVAKPATEDFLQSSHKEASSHEKSSDTSTATSVTNNDDTVTEASSD